MTSPQHPIGSGFGAATTASDVLEGQDLTGKTVIVTGGYSGLGLEVTRTLAGAGATVVVPARDPERARHALAGITGVEQEHLDLGSAGSIDAFATRFLESGRPLDGLINNGGIMAAPFSRDARGYESHLAINHLGHFQLTEKLSRALVQADGARVVSLTSRAYRFSPVDFDDPNYLQRAYEKWGAYAQSMTAKSLFAVALDARGRSYGVRSFAVHPGTIVTPLVRHLSTAELQGLGAADDQGNAIQPPGAKTIPQGAATTVWAATSPQLDGHGGAYLDDVDIASIVDSSADLYGPGVDSWAVDPDAADRLWALSEQLIGRRSTIR
jgi:NAD(P)-dependent dehydrogenase (short-subunit alcohol dehydrogenase family)